MKIKAIFWERRNDFQALMVCEHCGHEWMNHAGYHDNFYHTKVIPSMHCEKCGKNRAGVVEPHRETVATP